MTIDQAAEMLGVQPALLQPFAVADPFHEARHAPRVRSPRGRDGVTGAANSLCYDRPRARLARATAGMTQIVASRHRREMFAIDANHTSPIATVTSSTH